MTIEELLKKYEPDNYELNHWLRKSKYNGIGCRAV